MKFSFAAISALLVADHTSAFVTPRAPLRPTSSNGSRLHMAMDMPPAQAGNSDLPVVQQNSYGQPSDIRYSDFLKLVNADRVEKVTFSSDGTQLLGVDVDGARIKIASLPNDPGLLTQLTNHKVRRFSSVLFSLCSSHIIASPRDELSGHKKYSLYLSFTFLLVLVSLSLTHTHTHTHTRHQQRSMSLSCQHKKPVAWATWPKALFFPPFCLLVSSF